MLSKSDARTTKGGANVIVSAEAVSQECTFMVRRIPSLVAPEVTSRKKQFDIIAKLTGIKPRRVKDYFRGDVKNPPAAQDRTIRNAYRAALLKWKTSALEQLEQIEADHGANLRAAADYSSTRWERTSNSGRGVGDVGAPPAGAADQE